MEALQIQRKLERKWRVREIDQRKKTGLKTQVSELSDL